MFHSNSKVEDGRVRAHETAETATEKVHSLIDTIAEHVETGAEKAGEAKVVAAAKAADVRSEAQDRAAELRGQAEAARKDARKTAKKKGKVVRRDVKKAKKQGRKKGKEVASSAQDLRSDILKTAAGLAASGAAAGKAFGEEASHRAPEAFAALKDDHDTHAALAALKGEKRRSGRGKLLLLIAIAVGGAAFAAAKRMQGPKKDPWAVPAGDPYKAPATGRDSTVGAASSTPIADQTAAASTTGADAPGVTGETRTLTDSEVDKLATGTPAGTDSQPVDGDAWSSARDWADDAGVPSTTGTSEGTSDLTTEHLGSLDTDGKGDKS